MRADLHLHTHWSDGSYSPEEIARRVAESGTELFSITDHDSMEGSEEGALAARRYGLGYVRGWEISSYEKSSKVHILGYGCAQGEVYRRFFEERLEGARVRARLMLAAANEYFKTNVTMDDVEAYHVRKSTPIHTMHVVSAFAERLQRRRGELYLEAFAYGGPAYTEECRPSPEEAVEVIHALGGIAVLAHPGRIVCLEGEDSARYRKTDDKGEREALKAQSDRVREGLLERLVRCGLDGIECHYTTHTAIETEQFAAFARRHGLWITGGSDFHADGESARVGSPVFEPDEGLAALLLSGRGSVS